MWYVPRGFDTFPALNSIDFMHIKFALNTFWRNNEIYVIVLDIISNYTYINSIAIFAFS